MRPQTVTRPQLHPHFRVSARTVPDCSTKSLRGKYRTLLKLSKSDAESDYPMCAIYMILEFYLPILD